MRHFREGGPGGRCEAGGDGGWGGTGRRYFGRGYVKFALLELLEQEPMHGYQMMKALEERSDGRYTPSAGSIYPTLQMLEDRGWIEADEADGKKIYRSTEAGRAGLREWRGRERKERPPLADEADGSSRERRLADGFELIHLLTRAEQRASCDPAYAGRLRRFLDGALQELRSLHADVRTEEPREADRTSGAPRGEDLHKERER